MEIKSLSLEHCELKFADNAKTFTGYASVFGGVDSYGDTILPGAFKSVVGEGTAVKMYYNHGWKENQLPIGRMLVEEDERGLRVKEAEFTPGIKSAEEVYQALRHGSVDGLSIAYQLKASNYKTNKHGGKDIYSFAKLREVSVVDYPADSNATIDSVKSAIDEAETLKELETILRDAGRFSRGDACALVARVKALAHGDRGAEPLVSEIEAVFRRYT